MTMTSELKKTKRNSVNRFFTQHASARVKPTISSSTTGLSQPSSTTNASSDGGRSGTSHKRHHSIYLIQDKRVMGKIEVDDYDETEVSSKPRHMVKTTLKRASSATERPRPPQKSLEVEGLKFKESSAKAQLAKKLEEVHTAITEKATLKHKGVRTFRLWHPKQRRSVLVRIGATADPNIEEGKRIFNLQNIHAKTFDEWKKEAKLILPSVTGGPAVEAMEDVIHITPTIQKEKNPRVMEKQIRRLSQSRPSDASSSGTKKKAVSIQPIVDYSAVREIRKSSVASSMSNVSNVTETEEPEPEEELDPEQKKRKQIETIVEIDSDDEEQQLAEERKLAGVDIKGKLHSLRELGEHLSHKRDIRHHIVEKATGQTVLDAEYIPIKEHLLYLGEYLRDFLHDVFVTFLFWERSIVEITGRFGVVASSYFIWLRKIVVLNMFMFLVTLLAIIVPQILEDSEDDDLDDKYNNKKMYTFSLSDLIHGEGSFHYSYLYYSGYHNRNEEHPNPFKNPAFRFLLAILIIFFINTIFIFSHIGAFIQGAHVQTKVSGVSHNQNFTSIICGWDFSCGDPEAASFLRKAIQRELHILATTTTGTEKQTLEIETDKNKRALACLVKIFGLKCGSIVMHVISNLFLVASCCAMGYSIWYLCLIKLNYYIECIPDRDDGTTRKLNHTSLCPKGDLYLYATVMSLPAVFASVATLSLNWAIQVVGDMEIWGNTERRVYASMTRAGTFYATSLFVFYYFWISKEPELRSNGFVAETIFGKELYRLVVIKGLIDIILNVGYKLFYHLLQRKSSNYKKSTFLPEYNAMNMFFLHFVGTMGILYCPGASLLVLLRLIFDFYIQRYTLLKLSSNEAYVSHASTVFGPYVITFLVAYLLAAFGNMYYLADTVPSKFDGPFIYYEVKYFDAITTKIHGSLAVDYFRLAFEPGFLIALIAILTASFYFCRQWAKAYEPVIQQLNSQIFLDRSDRDTLLKAIFEIGKATSAVPLIDDRQLGRRSFINKRFSKLSNVGVTDIRATTGGPANVERPSESSSVASTMPAPIAPEIKPQKKVEETRKGSTEAQSTSTALTAEEKQQKKKEKEIKRMFQIVQGEKDKVPLGGLQKMRKDSGVHVDTWNAQRHRRENMEKIVKGIVGARRGARIGANGLNYDPTSKIFPKQEGNSSGNSSGSSSQNQSPKGANTTTNNKPDLSKAVSNIAKNYSQTNNPSTNNLKPSIDSQQSKTRGSFTKTQSNIAQRKKQKRPAESNPSSAPAPKNKKKS